MVMVLQMGDKYLKSEYIPRKKRKEWNEIPLPFLSVSLKIFHEISISK